MSSRLRFLTARQVFEAFPAAAADVAAAPTDDDPLVFMRALVDGGAAEDALSFAAYLLPRREAVWWACRCLDAMGATAGDGPRAALAAAEAWVRRPEEDVRREALDVAETLPPEEAATWLAFAAGWSGGSMVSSDLQRVPPPPHLTAKAVRSALVLGLAVVDQRQRGAWAVRAAESCIRFAGGGEATL